MIEAAAYPVVRDQVTSPTLLHHSDPNRHGEWFLESCAAEYTNEQKHQQSLRNTHVEFRFLHTMKSAHLMLLVALYCFNHLCRNHCLS
jgi:hypothetical protein